MIWDRHGSYIMQQFSIASFVLGFCLFYVLELFNGNELKSISVDFSVGGSTDS